MNRLAVLACALAIILPCAMAAQAERPGVSPAMKAARPGVAMPPQERLRRQAAQALGLREMTPARPATPLNVWPAGLHPAPVRLASGGGLPRVYPAQAGTIRIVETDQTYPSIQAAINAAENGQTIEVGAGTYVENLIWNNKDLQLLGAGAEDTIVDGNEAGSCLRMTDVPATSRIEGFTFTNGNATGSGALRNGGGLYLDNSSPTISHNTISGNSAQWFGGGLSLWNGSSPTISSNTISENSASSGGGIHLDNSSLTISNSTISRNSAWGGGGLSLQNGSSATISSNTISGNSADYRGGGLDLENSSPTITNTIITFSTSGGGISSSLGATVSISYSNVYGNTGGNYENMSDQTGLNGNISEDPLFANAAGGDFHLKSKGGRWDGAAWVNDEEHSPCIASGDPASDYNNEPDPNGGRINMGRWGNTAEASKYSPLPPAPHAVWVNAEYGPDLPNDGHTWGHDAFDTIQGGINRVASPGMVHVAAGIYVENVAWGAKDIQLLGAGAEDTIVDGDEAGSCLRMSNVPETSRIEGFTFTRGYATGRSESRLSYGGGLYLDNSSPTISNSTISGNSADSEGGGLHLEDSSPTITNTNISSNSADRSGGGLYLRSNSSPTISNTTISENSANWTGGGLFLGGSSPTISNSTISGNSAGWSGGAMRAEGGSPTITNTTISNNSAGSGGGLYLLSSSPTISNTTISGNSATNTHGGGVYVVYANSAVTINNTIISDNSATNNGGGVYVTQSASPTITNTTISGNSATNGGGLYVQGTAAAPTLTNTIIAFSTSGAGIHLASGTVNISYSNVFGNAADDYIGFEGPPTGTNGNISEDPLFADADNGDFHLRSRGGRWDPASETWVTDSVHSPCIDAGDPEMPVGEEPAPHGDRINMGAYGGTQWASKSLEPPVLIVETGVRYPTIQEAINAAENGQTIEVGAGTYVENLIWNNKDLQLLGAGAEDTIVDGNEAGSCLRMANVPDTSRIEGFTFTNGNAAGGDSLNHGGGLYLSNASPTISNNTFSGNSCEWYGGGLSLFNGSSPTISNNTISENSAGAHGGGLCLHASSSPTISNTTISANSASVYGGGLVLYGSVPMITGTTITGNSAGVEGGALFLRDASHPTIVNTTISGNSASRGGGLALSALWSQPSPQPTIRNTIIAFSTSGGGIYRESGTVNISYSNVYGNTGGEYEGMADQTGLNGNISEDPLFADADNGDFHLRSRAGRWDPAAETWVIDEQHSPCIDAGDPNDPVGEEPEPHGDRINMGAYGGTQWASKSWTDVQPAPTVTGIAPDSGLNDGPVDVTITGTDFREGATAKLTREGEEDIEGAEVEVVGEQEITCTFDLDGAAAGAWDVVVTNDDEQSGALVDGFEVQHVQPDLLIRNADEAEYIGEGIYNETGENQTREQDASPGQPAVFHVQVVNRGTVADRFIITGVGGGMVVGTHEGRQAATEVHAARKVVHDWTVRYFAGLGPDAEDITAQVLGDGWPSDELAANGGAQEIRVVMTPDRFTPAHDVCEALVTARSAASAKRLDAVRAVAHNLPRRQPDLHVHRPVEGDVVGDDVYNDTGAGQTADHASDGTAPAAYRVLLENDGNVPDRFIITARDAAGGAVLADWRVSVLDAPTDGVDISNQVLGQGWTSPQLAMGDIMELRVEVTPEDAARAGAACAVLLHAHSATEMARRDAVLVHTTKTGTHRPDMLIRPADEADYLGDDVYSDDGAGQTATQTTPAGLAATYHLRVVNKGNCPDEYLITAPALVTTATAAPTGWTVRLFDALTGGADITDAVLGEGWRTPELAAASGQDLRLEVTPDSTLPGDAMLDALITATSAAHAAARDTVKAVTHNAADYQPDMLIRNAGETDYVGGGIHNTDGAGQGRAQVVNGGLAVYHLRARNDGNVPQRLNVTAAVHEVGTSAEGGPAWSTTFFDAPEGGHEITEQIRGAGWETDVLHPGEAVDLRLETRLGPDVPGNATQRTLITATSADDPDASDTVRATTAKAPVHQPDLVIRNAGDADFVGHDIINETGEGQTTAQTVPVGATAVYDVQVHNAGNVAEAYLVTLPGGAGEGWQVRLFDGLTDGDDITAEVTGDGWMTPELPPGEFHALRMEATPGPAVGPLAVCRALLRAASLAEGGGADAVRADTTRAAVHQPDLIICAAPDGPCVGEGIHNETGEGQTMTMPVAASETAPFHITIRNDGDMPDRFTITAPGAPGDGWALLWRDAPTGGADITTAITGDGWTTPELAPTEQHTLLLHVTPGEGVHGGAVLELTARAVSLAEPARSDVVKAVTEMTRISRPDMLIRSADETDYAGDGLYNDTGEGQSRALTIAGETTAVFELMLRNAGNAPEEFLVTLDGGILPTALTEAGWTIALYDALSGGADVTDAAASGGWLAGPLAPQAAREFRLEIRPGDPVPGREAWEALVTATSTEDPGKSDTVKATTVKRQSQPDAMIRGPADADYLGEGILNDTAEGQTTADSVALTARATYLVRVRNAGNMPDSFLITSPAHTGGGWQVAFFDAAIGGADITTDVTGAGWTVGPLDAGEAANLRLEVTAHTAEALSASQEALVTATSTGDPAAADTVAALTTLLPPAPLSTDTEAGVWLLGVPGLPLNPSADAVFGVPQVVRWDAAAQAYEHFADTPFDVIPGHGYWARFPAGHEVSFDGYPLEAPPTVAVAPGWNLLGNSLSHSLPWSAVTATGDVDAYAWKLNPQGTDYVLVWSLAGLNWETEIGPWEGFWLRAREHCAVTLGAAQGAHDAPRPTAPAPAWVIQLRARAGEAVDGSNFVGVAGGNAPVRVHAPPPLAGSRVSLHVDAAGERHAVSLVGEADRTAWDLVARTDLPDTQVEITLPDLSQVPTDLAVTLTDLATGRAMNMRTSTGYAFASGPEGGERRFRLEVKPRVMQAPVITALAAQPTASGAQVVYTLSAEAEVEVEVMNIAGRTVARVPAGRREAGTHTALWSGRTLGGAPAPPGRYLVTVRCAAEDGTQATRVVPVHTSR